LTEKVITHRKPKIDCLLNNLIFCFFSNFLKTNEKQFYDRHCKGVTKMKLPKLLQILASFSVSVLILFQPACYNRTAAVQLTESAIETSNILAKVYEDLAKQAEDTWDLSIYATGIERIREEERRAELGRSNGTTTTPTPVSLSSTQQKLVRGVKTADPRTYRFDLIGTSLTDVSIIETWYLGTQQYWSGQANQREVILKMKEAIYR
jgi:hypothetical protein